MRQSIALLVTILLLASCGTSTAPPPGTEAGEPSPLDPAVIERITGRAPAAQGSEYKISVPHHELGVVVDGFQISPPMGLTSWAAFAPAAEGAVVMGDLVLLETEVGPVQQTLLDSGLDLSALHNHFVRDQPAVMFMHIHGRGPLENLARGVQAALARVAELRSGLEMPAPSTLPLDLDTDRIDRRLGHTGSLNGGIYKITVGRPDVSLSEQGRPVSTFLGFNTWMAFQGTPERAAVSGDFAMLAGEVPAVIRALAGQGIEVVALHNHMLHEQPRIFFLHFWGVGSIESLLDGLSAALAETGGNPGEAGRHE